MKHFDEFLLDDIAQYEGRHDDLIFQAPTLFRLMVKLLDDPRFKHSLRQPLILVIAYFILPMDIIPEELEGPYGYIDDIFLSAWILERVITEQGEDIIEENWDGECPIISLIHEITSREQELIGDQKQNILKYIGMA